MTMVRLLAIAAIAVAAACGNSTGYSNPPPAPPPPPPPPPPGGHSTTITVGNGGNNFSPTPDTVPSGKVTFQWAAASATHNVTWDSGPSTPANSGNMGAGSSFVSDSLKVGTYKYHCTIHGASMSGTIVSQ